MKLSYGERYASLGGKEVYLDPQYVVSDRDKTLVAVLLPQGYAVGWL